MLSQIFQLSLIESAALADPLLCNLLLGLLMCLVEGGVVATANWNVGGAGGAWIGELQRCPPSVSVFVIFLLALFFCLVLTLYLHFSLSLSPDHLSLSSWNT